MCLHGASGIHVQFGDQRRRGDCAMGQSMRSTVGGDRRTLVLSEPLRLLTEWHIQQIDEALASTGPFAEIRLVKNKGKLRFIQTLESEGMLEPHRFGE